MVTLLNLFKPQIARGGADSGGGGPKIKPTGFADQAARMAKSQRQLNAPKMPGFDTEPQKNVPSVARRKSSKDSAKINRATGGFSSAFMPTSKSGSQPRNDGEGFKFKSGRTRTNPITGQEERTSVIISPDGSMTKTDFANKFADRDNRDIGMHKQLAASSGRPRNINTRSGKVGILPNGTVVKGGIEQDKRGRVFNQGTNKALGLPSPTFDDFIPRNPDGSPKYTAPDGTPLRRPYDPSTPSRPTPPPGGGKGGDGKGIALPPQRKPTGEAAPTRPVTPALPSRPTPPVMRPDPRPTPPNPGPDMPTLPVMRPDPRPTPPNPGPDMPRPRPIVGPPVMRPGPTIPPGGGKGGGGPSPMPPGRRTFPTLPPAGRGGGYQQPRRQPPPPRPMPARPQMGTSKGGFGPR